MPGFRGPADRQSRTEHLVISAGFALVPICYAVEDAFRPEGSSAIYPLVAVAYVALFLGSGFVHTRPAHSSPDPSPDPDPDPDPNPSPPA